MQRIRRLFGILAAACVACSASSSTADVRLPAIFGDHMVLQRGGPIPVWGKADPGEQVTVSIAGQTQTATAGPDGRWSVRLDPIESRQPMEMTVAGRNTITLGNVVMGEVWLASGQSNMEWTVKNSRDPEQEIANANFPEIRLFNVSAKKRPTTQPADDVEAQWLVCSPDTVANFSAVAYHFGRHLHERLDQVPVGLINASWGGMPAEAFTDATTLASDPAFAVIARRHEEAIARYPEAKAKYEQQIKDWEVKAEQAKAAGTKPPNRPWPPYGPESASVPSALWNGMIHPLKPYAIRGAIWYQGESNAGRWAEYEKLLSAMIEGWRREWNQPGPARDFPFLIVQLANYQAPATQPVQADSNWAHLRETQADVAAKVPNVGMAVIIDIGEAEDIHPKNKQDVGRRLGLQAEKIAYGRDVVASGPTFRAMTVEGNVAILTFDHVGGGLRARGSEGGLAGFAIAGDDGVWHYADASSDGETVRVSSPDVAKPKAVRYGWAQNPPATLFNAEGLPAAPFRTDR